MKHQRRKLTTDKNFATNARIRKSAFCGATKKSAMEGKIPCIGKKIIVVCNYWGLLVPTHDFLFNSKTAFYQLSIYIETQKRSPTIKGEKKWSRDDEVSESYP
ncbi:hypothetical protein [Okeania sp. KiyG1]|uniref:hypothetical protein n=1 Tax=Okeania sp. KiyG1 TaxID=2720165 RepID=UPI00192511E3|nr:hypothetical protein [Okeania sp. KiyG1]